MVVPEMVAKTFSFTHRGRSTQILNGVPQSVEGSSTLTWQDTRSDAYNPSWRRAIKNHTSATTNTSGIRRIYFGGNGSASITYKQGNSLQNTRESKVEGGFYLLPSTFRALAPVPSSSLVGQATTAAKINYLQKVRENYRLFQGGVFLGELRETLRMIKRPAQALRSGIDSYHGAVKERLRRAGSNKRIAWDIVRGTWLEYVFGWRPAINDIEGAMKALAYKDYREFVSITGIGRAEGATFVCTTYGVPGGSVLDVKLEYSTRTSVVVRLKGECGSTPASTSVGNLDRWGFGRWEELAPTIYELIPYSFLVDYFSNLGNIIDAAATNTAALRWTNQTVRVESERLFHGLQLDLKSTGQGIGVPNGTALITGSSCNYGGYVNRYTAFTRSAPSTISVGLSDLRFRIPGVGSTKWLNIAALARLRR